MPTALDNGQRSLRGSCSRWSCDWSLAREPSEQDAEDGVPGSRLGEGPTVREQRWDPLRPPCRVEAVDEVGEWIEPNVLGHCHA